MGSPASVGEHRYVYTHVANGAALCTLSVIAQTSSGFDSIAAALLEGKTCAGPEVPDSCDAPDEIGGYFTWEYNFHDDDAGDYVLVIDGGPQSTIDYYIDFTCAYF